MYKLYLEKQPRKFVINLPKKKQAKVIELLDKLKVNPRPVGCLKLIQQEGYRIRFGDYRILFTVDDQNKEIIIYKISHRQGVYDD